MILPTPQANDKRGHFGGLDKAPVIGPLTEKRTVYIGREEKGRVKTSLSESYYCDNDRDWLLL